MSLRGLGAVATFALFLGASGCHTFKYFDIHVTFDPGSGFDDASVKSINDCRVLVTGADSDSFILGKCPNRGSINPLDVGNFEFSSFAETGTMNFEVKTFIGLADKPACQVGDGKVAIPVTAATTITGDLMIAKLPSDPACPSGVTPAGDGGP
jgi:hypothetical protein